MGQPDIPEKANWVLNVILLTLLLIVVRLWHLTVIQHDSKLEEARRPQTRVVTEAARRATICDRFHIPLAVNKIQYQAAVVYSQIRQIPSVVWKKDASGNSVKHYARREYISSLVALLAKELKLDPLRLEDLIYSKAALYANIPFVIKEEIGECEYYRLQMLAKDWPGIHVQRLPKRTYPLGRVASDIIGYMGSISREEYDAIVHEIKSLEHYLAQREEGEDPPLPDGVQDPQQAREKLQELQERAYTVSDHTGKAGIEARFEQELRGYQGKKSYYSDSRGNFLRELPGSTEPIPGQRVELTISAELQEYAEKLLVKNETARQAFLADKEKTGEGHIALKQLWTKGGAIVVMDPNNGDLLAMASCPRIDPNDFVSSGNREERQNKRQRVQRWLETEQNIADIWDQKRNLERERYDDKKNLFWDEILPLSWEAYLKMTLSVNSPIHQAFIQVSTVGQAIRFQHAVDKLLSLCDCDDPYYCFQVLYGEEETVSDEMRMRLQNNENELKRILKTLDPILKELSLFDQVLFLDLCRLVVPADLFDDSLTTIVGKQSLATYRDLTAAFSNMQPITFNLVKSVFHDTLFKVWREKHEKEFLKQKRIEEKSRHIFPKPYIDYLDKFESALFQDFWNTYRWPLLWLFLRNNSASEVSDDFKPYLEKFMEWKKKMLPSSDSPYCKLSDAVSALPLSIAESYLRTFRSYQDLDRQLYGQYPRLRSDNGKQTEQHLAAAFYPRYGFGYGRSYAYRQAATQGSIFKLVPAYTALWQAYCKNPQSKDPYPNPLVVDDVLVKRSRDWIVGYQVDGTVIPQIYKGGRIPRSDLRDIGRVDLVRALEYSSNLYFSLLASEVIDSPEDFLTTAKAFSFGTRTGINLPGEISGFLPTDVIKNKTGLYSLAIGQHSLVVTPLQTAVLLSAIANGGHVLKPHIVSRCVGKTRSAFSTKEFLPEELRTLPMPRQVRSPLLEGMRLAAARIPQASGIKGNLIGKTSTSQAIEHLDPLSDSKSNMYRHIWFGGLGFEGENYGDNFLFRDETGKPDLVVVVYLRFGRYGKDAAQLAAQVATKWRQIKGQ